MKRWMIDMANGLWSPLPVLRRRAREGVRQHCEQLEGQQTPSPTLPRGTGRGSKIAALVALLALSSMASADPMVKDGDVLAIIGDSITEGRQYGSLVENYLLMCQPAKVRVMQFGWSGENVSGFNNRMADFLAMKPTVATLCYGMNDGMYKPVDDRIREMFREGLTKGVRTLKKSGTRVLVGSPGCVDTATFQRPTVSAADYNTNLAALRDEARGVAQATDSPFADVHTAMIEAMWASKSKFGPDYPFAGGDGVHPSANGGLVMAYAFLKGLGFDGDVGTISIDLAKHSVSATGGHRIKGFKNDTVTLVSTQYPFCFFGRDDKDPAGTRGIAGLTSFNKDLNRLTLIATGPAAKYRVTWGDSSRTFTAEQLKDGVNLAAEFFDNPFCKPFMAVHQKVLDKQGTENLLLKQLLHSTNSGRKFMPETAMKDLDGVLAAVPKAQQKLSMDVAAEVKPVTHTITIQPAD